MFFVTVNLEGQVKASDRTSFYDDIFISNKDSFEFYMVTSTFCIKLFGYNVLV